MCTTLAGTRPFIRYGWLQPASLRWLPLQRVPSSTWVPWQAMPQSSSCIETAKLRSPLQLVLHPQKQSHMAHGTARFCIHRTIARSIFSAYNKVHWGTPLLRLSDSACCKNAGPFLNSPLSGNRTPEGFWVEITEIPTAMAPIPITAAVTAISRLSLDPVVVSVLLPCTYTFG